MILNRGGSRGTGGRDIILFVHSNMAHVEIVRERTGEEAGHKDDCFQEWKSFKAQRLRIGIRPRDELEADKCF